MPSPLASPGLRSVPLLDLHSQNDPLRQDILAAIARVLGAGGTFLFASDIDHYVGWTLARVLRSKDLGWTAQRPDDWRRPFEGWPGTRYERKAVREGRTPSYITVRKR